MAHTVLRGHLQLAADVVLDQVGEEFTIFVLEKIVKANPRANENLFDARDLPQFSQQEKIIGVIRVQVGTWGGGQAVPVLAQAVFALLLTGGPAEIGGGAAHVMDIAFEPRVLGEGGDLPENALVAAGGYHPPLVEGQGTEFAGPKAPPVVGDGKAYLFNGRHAAHGVIDGMGLPKVGQLRHFVQLLGVQGHGGGIGDEVSVPVGLDHRPAPDGVVLVILHQVGRRIGPLVPGDRFVGGHRHSGKGADAGVFGEKAGPFHRGDLCCRCAGGQESGQLPGGPLPHAIGEQVGLGVQEDGAPDLVLPVIVVGEPAQGGLQPPDDNGDVPKGLPDLVGVDNGGPVRPQARPVARGVGIVVAPLPGGGIMGHHGVDVSPVDEDPVPGAAHIGEGGELPPVGLGQDGHPVPLRLQYPADDGGAEGGVVHIGVPGDHQKIIVVPSPLQHVRPGDGQKITMLVQSNAPWSS